MRKLLLFGTLGLGLALGAIGQLLGQVVTSPPQAGVTIMACANNTVIPSVVSGSGFMVQCDASGNLLIKGSITIGAGTTSNGIDAVATSNTNNADVSFMYGFNGTTWDRVQVDASKNVKVNVNAALPTGANTIGAVTQASGPWTQNLTQVNGAGVSLGQAAMASSFPVVVASNQTNLPANIVQWAGGALGAMANYGTSPGAVLVPGVNAFITNTPTVTANAGTNLNTSLLALESGGNLATLAGAVSASKVNVNISSGSIPTGTNIIGKVGIDQTTDVTTNGVEIAPTAGSAAGITPIVSPSAETSRVLKASAGNLYSVYVTTGATAGFLMVHNTTTAPGNGAVTPLECVQAPANQTTGINYNPGPVAVFSTGISATFSTTGCFTQTNSATAFFKGNVK